MGPNAVFGEKPATEMYANIIQDVVYLKLIRNLSNNMSKAILVNQFFEIIVNSMYGDIVH